MIDHIYFLRSYISVYSVMHRPLYRIVRIKYKNDDTTRDLTLDQLTHIGEINLTIREVPNTYFPINQRALSM